MVCDEWVGIEKYWIDKTWYFPQQWYLKELNLDSHIDYNKELGTVRIKRYYMYKSKPAILDHLEQLPVLCKELNKSIYSYMNNYIVFIWYYFPWSQADLSYKLFMLRVLCDWSGEWHLLLDFIRLFCLTRFLETADVFLLWARLISFPTVPKSNATMAINMTTMMMMPKDPMTWADGRWSWRVFVEYMALFLAFNTGSGSAFTMSSTGVSEDVMMSSRLVKKKKRPKKYYLEKIISINCFMSICN